MKEVLLSIIIPCYNGEKCIEKCINSIINQTYKNLEIIIIDDGSTDNSYLICNNLAIKDKRIKIIKQQNIGSSLTRKKGINLSSADFITFVDADDWIHPKMYDIMMKGIINENADIAQCGVCNAFINDKQQIELNHRFTSKISEQYKKYNRVEGVLKILDDREWRSYMHNKIYRKELFCNIQFPEGRFLDEDLSIMHQIFHNANTSIYFESEFYYYLQGSITQVKDEKNNAKRIVDRCNARWERYIFTKKFKEYHPMVNKMHNIFLSVSLTGLRWAIKHPKYISETDLKNIYFRIKDNPIQFKKLMKEYFSIIKTIELYLLKTSPILYKYLIKNFI